MFPEQILSYTLGCQFLGIEKFRFIISESGFGGPIRFSHVGHTKVGRIRAVKQFVQQGSNVTHLCRRFTGLENLLFENLITAGN